jgi:hypothetical protein
MAGPREIDDFGPTWFLLRPLPGWGGVPASVRMRRALKCLLRGFGIRCEAMRDAPPEQAPVQRTRSSASGNPASSAETARS